MASESGKKDRGEGSYEGTRDYNERTRKYLKDADVEQDARRAAPEDDAEAERLRRAEQAGKRHAKDEDPALDHPDRVGREE